MPNAHGYPALHLAGHEFRHNDLTGIEQVVVAHDLYLARKGIV